MQDTIFHLPDLGEGLREAEVVAWHVAAGDHVVADQPLVSVETDKAVVEVPAPRSGHIAKLVAEIGERIEVGAPLIEYEQGAHADTGGIVGELESAERATGPVPKPRPPALGIGVKATPAVRAMATRLGVDLADVTPTGPDGAIVSRDVENAAQTGQESGARPDFEPLRGVRRAMAERMSLAHREVVPATVTAEADVEDWPDGTEVMLRLIQAMAVACQSVPALNAWFDGKSLSRRMHETVDLGIAMNTEDGLFVPVLRNVGGRSPHELQQGLERLKADVQARRLPSQELRGQTITLSNFGPLGAGRFASLVVVPPQVAILGAGMIERRVVAVAGNPKLRRILPLSLTFDHRVVTGGEAAQFLNAIISRLERPDHE